MQKLHPKVETKRGPIVLHGGFTSAFYDFQEDGTGRLVISIACWLIRKEELAMNIAEGIEKAIPPIPIPENKNIIFDKWIKGSMFSILILDVSGSMSHYYKRLFDITNEIIQKQMENEENEGVVILFGDYAKAVINGKYRLLEYDKDIIDLPAIGRATNFFKAFTEAEKYIYNQNRFENDEDYFGNKISNSIFKSLHGNKTSISSFEHLKEFASENCFFTCNNFKEVEIKMKVVCAE